MVKKLIKDGKVAVLISSGFGAGWSTWNSDYATDLLFDKDIAHAILNEDHDVAYEIAEEKYPDAYLGGLEDGLIVEWVDEGALFEVEEYDGAESLHVIGSRNYIKA